MQPLPSPVHLAHSHTLTPSEFTCLLNEIRAIIKSGLSCGKGSRAIQFDKGCLSTEEGFPCNIRKDFQITRGQPEEIVSSPSLKVSGHKLEDYLSWISVEESLVLALLRQLAEPFCIGSGGSRAQNSVFRWGMYFT